MNLLKTIAGALTRERETLDEKCAREREELATRHAELEREHGIRHSYASHLQAVENAEKSYQSFCNGIDADCSVDLASIVSFQITAAAGYGVSAPDWKKVASLVSNAEALKKLAPKIKAAIYKKIVGPVKQNAESFFAQHRDVLEKNPMPEACEPPPAVAVELPPDHYQNTAKLRQFTRQSIGDFDGKN